MLLQTLKSRAFVGFLVSILAFFYVFWVAGGVLRTAGDEGIYLEGGRRVAGGEQPYRDFFALTGPLTFWIEGAIGKWSGLNAAAMRLPMMFAVAFLTWTVFWFTSRFAGSLYSTTAALSYLAIETRVRKLVVNHRWDSAALATGALAAAFAAQRQRRWWLWGLSGLLIASAVLATPSMWIVGVVVLWWSTRSGRGAVAAFAGGGATVGAIAAAYLQSQHALQPMLAAFQWTAAHYTRPNRVYFGQVITATTSVGRDAVFYLALVYSALPAIIPVTAILFWGWRLCRKRDSLEIQELLPLAVAAVGFIFAAWPRWASDTLLHTLAISWVVGAVLLYRTIGPHQRHFKSVVVLLAAIGILTERALPARDYVPRETRRGNLAAPGDESEFLGALERWIQPGDSLFVFPYEASLYYFLGAHNPTSYSFLQPGMMTAQDEQRAVAELAASPPQWICYEKWPEAGVLSIWPNSDPALIPMPVITAYISQNYRNVESVTGTWGTVLVMKREVR